MIVQFLVAASNSAFEYVKTALNLVSAKWCFYLFIIIIIISIIGVSDELWKQQSKAIKNKAPFILGNGGCGLSIYETYYKIWLTSFKDVRFAPLVLLYLFIHLLPLRKCGC